MAMGEHDGANPLPIFHEIGDFRDNDVDPEQLGLRKHQAGVDDDDVVTPAHGHAVHSELAQPAQRHDFELASWHGE